MRFGFFGVNAGVLSEPATMVAAATTAEAAGWESIWTGEHLVAASPQRPPSPVRPDTHFVDQVASLAHLAAQTITLRLGTGIVILPQRNPVVLAKELASVDVLSGGRLEAGFGVGYVPDEFNAIGVPFSERGARMDDHIDALRAMWRGDLEFEGRFTSWHGVEAHPRPVEPHGPPIHVGGGSAATFRRAVLRADGWYGFLSTLESTGSAMDAMGRGMAELDRPAHLGRIQVSVTPSEPVDRDLVRRYEDLGV
ncbi:MAG: TIGR03619 family F420-dependent LLM class oxidoreductase, partial [Acidimicrobiales bacterium]|nr:TIGR03619 family F420-dependent LLM class oxidoreductase [Acidimicrobiales bacterium]